MLVRKGQSQIAASFQADRILVSVPNWVGDVVMATAALGAIRRRFSQARIVHLMRPYVAEVLKGTDLCDEEVFWPEKASPPGTYQANDVSKNAQSRGYMDLIGRLRSDRFDLALLLTNSFRSALVARLAGARRRVGYARDTRGFLLTDRLRPQKAKRKYVPISALDYYNELARSVGCEAVGDQLLLSTLPEDEAVIDHRLGALDRDRPLVVLNPGANYGPAKCWPAESYAVLADEMTTRYGARVVASLGPKEGQIAKRLAAAARQPLEVFIDPPLGLGPLRALIRRCRLLVTNDTGPRHFAAAFNVPVVTIFGSSDPAWTDTRYAGERAVKLNLDCQPCMERICPLGHHNCMRQLEPSRVLEVVDEILAAWHTDPARQDPSRSLRARIAADQGSHRRPGVQT